MAITYVDISNSALIRLGLSTIASFADGTKQANACAIRYQSCRDIVLRMYPWSCATQRVVLAPVSTPPAFEYTYAYELPADWLRTLDVCDDYRGTQAYGGDRQDYALESGLILCNYNPVYLRYVYQVQNAQQLDPECQECIALYLAYDLSQTLLNDSNLTQLMNKEFTAAMQKAQNVNAQEKDSCMVIDTYDRARLGWGSGYWGGNNFYDVGIG